MATTPGQVGAGVVLSAAQTGNADSTNVLDRGGSQRAAALVITTAVGGTPTVTVNIQGSVDGVVFYNVPYALVATPSTFVVTAIVITSATSTTYLLQSGQAWRILKIVLSLNTNVTVTATAFV